LVTPLPASTAKLAAVPSGTCAGAASALLGNANATSDTTNDSQITGFAAQREREPRLRDWESLVLAREVASSDLLKPSLRSVMSARFRVDKC